MTPPVPSPSRFLATPLAISLKFAAVAVASFSCWAFGGSWLRSEAALYAACAAIFLGFGSLAVHAAVADRLSRLRFFPLFAAAFLLYAAAWCAFWFATHDKRGEIFGSLTGAVAMAAVFRVALGRPSPLLGGAARLFFWHTAGYFGGEWLFDLMGGGLSPWAKLAWGAGYGLGFGAGLGAALQPEPARAGCPET